MYYSVRRYFLTLLFADKFLTMEITFRTISSMELGYSDTIYFLEPVALSNYNLSTSAYFLLNDDNFPRENGRLRVGNY